MIPAPFEYHAPTTMREALTLLRQYVGDAKVLAGGHSLIPVMKLRLAQPSHLIDLGRISDLRYVRKQGSGLAIGAMTTYHTLERSAMVQRYMPTLAEAAGLVGDVQVRNKGTIGGCIAHADPAADLPAVVVALDARIHTAGGRRTRAIPADRFFLDAFTTLLGETEVITRIQVPALPSGTGGSYQKFANQSSRFAVVGVAAFVTLDGKGICQRVRVGITGAGPKAIRARAAERYLEGKEPTKATLEETANRAPRHAEFQEDLHGSAEYRQQLTRELTRNALTEALRLTRG